MKQRTQSGRRSPRRPPTPACSPPCPSPPADSSSTAPLRAIRTRRTRLALIATFPRSWGQRPHDRFYLQQRLSFRSARLTGKRITSGLPVIRQESASLAFFLLLPI